MNVTRTPQRRLARIRGRARATEKRTSANGGAYFNPKPSAAIRASQPIANPDAMPERRRCNRIALDSEVLVRRIGGFNFNVALKDISTGGCRVELLEPSEVGDPVIARLPQLEPLGSRVCWAEGTATGVQFLTTIHPAVFDMLLTKLAPEDAELASL